MSAENRPKAKPGEQPSVLDYWNRDDVESMYDKHLLAQEIELIQRHISPGSTVLDAGCGEGESTLAYAAIPGTRVHAVDFSDTRLKKCAERVGHLGNVFLRKADFLGDYSFDVRCDVVVSQRFLINILDWELQKKVLLDLGEHLIPGGTFVMLEGSRQGTDSLNELRAAWNLEPIPPKWHNLFFDDEQLASFMEENGYVLIDRGGLGAYFLLTRGIRPTLTDDLGWDSDFNRIAASPAVRELLGFDTRFSRLKLWAFRRAS